MPQDLEITSGTSPVLKKAQKRFNRVKESSAEKKFREQAKKDVDYIIGEDQGWGDDDEKSKARQEGRPTVTMNRENPIFRLICGARPNVEATYTAVEEGDVETQEILNAVRKHVERYNRWEFGEDEWFKSGAMKSREVIEIMPDYGKDIRGEIKMKIEDGFKYYLDPDSTEKDRSDDRFRFKLEYMSPDEAKKLWPHKKTDIDNLTAGVTRDDDAEITVQQKRPDDYHDIKGNYYDATNDKLTVVYYWYKEYFRRTLIVDYAGLAVTGEPKIMESRKSIQDVKAELSKAAAPDRFDVVQVERTDVKYIVFIHDIILEDGDNPWNRADNQPTYLSQNFPSIVFEPERIHAGTRKELTSLMNPMHEPQKYYNRLSSAILQIIGATAHAGWEYEEGAASRKWIQKLKKYGSKAGFVMQWNKGVLTKGLARRVTPPSPPQAQMVYAEKVANAILDISGVESLVSTESLGKGASGVAIDLKQRQGGNVVVWLYDSFRFFEHMLAHFILDAIQVLYNYQKAIRITGTKTRYVRINEQLYDYTGAVVQTLNDVTVGQYDVAVTDKEVMPTLRMERLKQFVELVKTGALQLPPPVLANIVMNLMDEPELKQVFDDEMTEYQQQIQQTQAQGVEMAA